MNSLPKEHDFSEFVYYKYLLDYCNQKHINFYEERGCMLCVNKEAQPFAVADAHFLAHIHNSIPDADNLWNHSTYDNGITFMNQSGWKFYARQGPGYDKDRCPVLSNGTIARMLFFIHTISQTLLKLHILPFLYMMSKTTKI